jgi:hypothetical protein
LCTIRLLQHLSALISKNLKLRCNHVHYVFFLAGAFSAFHRSASLFSFSISSIFWLLTLHKTICTSAAFMCRASEDAA